MIKKSEREPVCANGAPISWLRFAKWLTGRLVPAVTLQAQNVRPAGMRPDNEKERERRT